MPEATFFDLKTLMKRRGIRTATELAHRLGVQGCPITPTYAAKILRDPPKEMRIALLRALVQVLECSADELLGLAASGDCLKAAPPAETRHLTETAGGVSESAPQLQEPASSLDIALPEEYRCMPPIRLLGRHGNHQRSRS